MIVRFNIMKGVDPSWNNVRIMITNNSSNSAQSGLESIHDCTFLGSVVLSPQQGCCSCGVDNANVTMPCCIRKTAMRNVVIYPNCCVCDTTFLENTVILPNSIIIGCGRITCTGMAFDNIILSGRRNALWKRCSSQYWKRDGRNTDYTNCRSQVQ